MARETNPQPSPLAPTAPRQWARRDTLANWLALLALLAAGIVWGVSP